MSVLFSNNSLSTLAGAIDNAVTTATLAPGTGARFPNPSGGDYFMLTFANANNTVWEIVKVTARSGDTITMVRGQEGTSPAAWDAGSLANGLITAGALTSFSQSANVRTPLVGATTFYVATTGNDTTGNGTSGAPWATLTHAFAVLAASYDFAGNTVTIQLADGTYTPNAALNYRMVGQTNPIIINGNSLTPTSVVYQGTISTSTNGWLQVQNMRMGGGGAANCLITGDGGFIYVGANMSFNTVSSDHLHTGGGGTIAILNSYSIVGGAANHINGLNGGNVGVSGGVTITLSGTPAFTEFLNLNVLAQFFGTPTFAGTGATGQKYNIANNAVAFTGGTNFPGNASGTTATGGQFS